VVVVVVVNGEGEGWREIFSEFVWCGFEEWISVLAFSNYLEGRLDFFLFDWRRGTLFELHICGCDVM